MLSPEQRDYLEETSVIMDSIRRQMITKTRWGGAEKRQERKVSGQEK
jgi:hypothetical protein